MQYNPSRRRSNPRSAGVAASHSVRTSSLYFAVNDRRLAWSEQGSPPLLDRTRGQVSSGKGHCDQACSRPVRECGETTPDVSRQPDAQVIALAFLSVVGDFVAAAPASGEGGWPAVEKRPRLPAAA